MMNFRKQSLIFLVISLVISLTPASAAQITDTWKNENNMIDGVENINNGQNSVESEFAGLNKLIDKLNILVTSMSNDKDVLMDYGKNLGSMWYKPWKWNECKNIITQDIPSTLGHMTITSGQMAIEASKINKEVIKLDLYASEDLSPDLYLMKGAEEDAQDMAKKLETKLNMKFIPKITKIGDLHIGDIVQYESQNKHFRYLRVIDRDPISKDLILEGSNGKRVVVPYNHFYDQIFVQLGLTWIVDSRDVLQVAAQIQHENIVKQKEKAKNFKAKSKSYDNASLPLFISGTAIVGLAGVVAAIGVGLGPETFGVSALVLGLIATGIGVVGGGLLVSYKICSKRAADYMNKGWNLENSANLDQEDLNYYNNNESQSLVAYNMNLTTEINKNLTSALNVTNPNNEKLQAEAILAPAHGILTFNGMQFTYKPLENFKGDDTFEYRITDEHGGVSNIATVQIDVTGEAIPVEPATCDIAVNKTFETCSDTPIGKILLLGDYTREELENNFTLIVVTMPRHGTLTVGPGATFTYRAFRFKGEDCFSYRVKTPDGKISNIAWVHLKIYPR